MRNSIIAVVLDGFHAGHTVRMEYMPTLKLLKPKVMRVDYCCGGDEIGLEKDEILEYKECFRAVDRKVVFFSAKGDSMDIIGKIPPQHPFKPWTILTTLYMGYHGEPILAKEDGTQMTEYEKGYERGITDGRILQAKESSPLTSIK